MRRRAAGQRRTRRSGGSGRRWSRCTVTARGRPRAWEWGRRIGSTTPGRTPKVLPIANASPSTPTPGHQGRHACWRRLPKRVGAVTVGCKCHGSWRLPSGRGSWASAGQLGGGGGFPFPISNASLAEAVHRPPPPPPPPTRSKPSELHLCQQHTEGW